MNIEELIGKLDLFLSTDGCNLDNETVQPVEGIYEEVKPESKEADKADMEQAEYKEVKAVEPEVDGDTVARKLLKQFEALEVGKIEKAEYDTIDIKEPEVEKAPKLEAEAVDIVEEQVNEEVVSEEQVNEISDEVVNKASEKRLSNFLNAIDKEKETFNDYVDARKLHDEELNGAKELVDIRKYQWQTAEEEKDKASDKLRAFDRLFYQRNKRKEQAQDQESVNEEQITEISQELADKVHTERQANAAKAVINAKKAELAAEAGIEKDPESTDDILAGPDKIDVQQYRDEAANALKKQRKNQKLYTKWRKAKGIDGFEGLDESLNEEKKDKPELVVEFEDGDQKHRIVRKDEKYFIQYNVNGKIRKTRTGVENLSTAVTALKKKCPNAVEIKREPEKEEK